MSVAGPYTFNLVNNSGLDSTNYSVRVLGYSVASQLILQPSANAGALQWGPLPTGVTLPATLANGSDTITFGNGLPAFTAVSVGDSISGSGIPAGTTITAISAEVTLNQAATSSANAPATIEAVILVGGVATKGSTEVTGLIPPPSVSNLRVGQTVIGTGIPAGTTLSQIDGVDAANLQITLSASATEPVSYSNTTPLTFCANVEGAFTTDGTAATLSSITATDQLTVNAAITSTAIPANTTVSQINSITITLSNAATSSGGSDLTFTPIQTATLTSGSGTVSVGAPNVLGTGRRLSGSGIPPGSTITAIDTTGSITVSNAATEGGQQSLTFWPATGVIPSFDIDEYTTFDFDPSTQTAGLNGARIYFFVVPGDWPSVASQPGFIGFPTNPPAFSYVYAVGLGVTQANDPPNSPSTTSSYPPFAIVEPTVDAASAGGGLHIDVQTVDGFTFPLSLTLLDSGNNSLGTVGQPVPAGNVVRSAIIEAYQAAYPSPSAYAALVYGGSSDIDGQYPGILNPGAYLADTSSAGSTLATVWNPVLTQLFNGTNVLNMVGDDSDYYQGTPSTVTTSGQTCNVIQFIGYTDTGMTQPNGNTFNIYSPLTPDPMAPNLSAGCQVFANDGVFHDVSSNVIVASSKVGRSATPPQVALGLQRDIVSALNRGVALEGPSGTTNRSAGDTSYYWAVETNWYPYTTTDTVNTHVQNNFSLFMHTAAVNSAPIFTQPTGAVATPQSLTMGMAYGFAYDEDPVHASSSAGSQPTVPSKFDPAPPGTATVTITVGPWSAS